MFENIGPISSAEVLKNLIKRIKEPLIDERQYTLIQNAQLLKQSGSKEEFENVDLVSYYINSVLKTISQEKLKTLAKLFGFLGKVIEMESETKMNVTNVSTIFAPLLLPIPKVTDIQEYIEENNKNIAFLKFLFEKYLQVGFHLLENSYSVGEYKAFSAIKTKKIGDRCILRGDQLVVFHRSKTFVCGILNNRRILVIVWEILEELFLSSTTELVSPHTRFSTTPRDRPASVILPRATC